MNDVTHTDILQAVRESAVLADVSISTWGGTVTDAKLLAQVKAQHGATGDVGKLVLNMLAGADELLKKTKSAFAAVRLRHYVLTLPWVSDPHATRQEGPRLLPHLLTERYMNEMSTLKRVAMAQLEEFLSAYPDLIAKAQANLSTMGVHVHYPTADELRNNFRVHFDFEPLPEFRTPREGSGIPLDNMMLERLAKGLYKKQERQLARANKVIWEHAAKPIKQLIERLSAVNSDDQKYLKESTLNAVREVITLLPGWNVTNDPALTEITQEIRDLVDGLDFKAIKTNQAVRSDVVRSAKKVADKMSQWGL